MRKEQKHVWITCSRRLEPVYAPLRNGKAHCTVCGELFPTALEGVDEETPTSTDDQEQLLAAS